MFEIRTTSKRKCAKCGKLLNYTDDRVEIKKVRWKGKVTTHVEKDFCFNCAIKKGLIEP